MKRCLAILALMSFFGVRSSAGGEALSMAEYQRLYPGEFALRKCLSSNHEQFLTMVEATLLVKMAKDIDLMLERGWADEVGPRDLFHAHLVLKRDKTAAQGCLNVLEGDNIEILYHAHEYDDRRDSKTRNIVSARSSQPRVAHPRQYSKGPYTVQGEDLDGWYGVNVYFGDTPEDLERHKKFIIRGPYKIGGRYFGFRSLIR
jgi:hypothetical protein